MRLSLYGSVIVGLAATAMAQNSTSPIITSAPHSGPPPKGTGSLQTFTYYDCTDISSVTHTVTDISLSTYCDKCDNVYVTEYVVSYTDICPTGLTTPAYTITTTCTGNPESFTTPTSCPESFSVYTKVCTVCEQPELTVTVTSPIPSPPATTAAPAPKYTTTPAPKAKPAVGTTSYTFAPAASTTGPALFTGGAVSTSSVGLFSVVFGGVGALFAVMVML